MADLTGKVLEGKYRLVRLVGAGGMASVYEAEHELIDRRVAVKLLQPELATLPKMAERFLREARSASEIKHPNIIEIFDVGRADDGHPFIVMELLEGQSLRELLVQEGRLALDRATSISLKILAGLQAAHQRGTIHRDLKPDNVFIVPGEDGTERVKILDFGISKVKDGDIGGDLTQTGAVLGTPHYMAPEQARGEADVDERIDVWAAGVVLYEMLSGARPYQGDTYNRVISQILVDPVPSLRDVGAGVPARLASVVDRALTKERDRRYANAAAMIDELRAVADELDSLMWGETVITPPESDAESTQLGGKPGTPQASSPLVDETEPQEPTGTRHETPRTSAPASDDNSAADATVKAPLWKRVLWLLLCLPIPLQLLLAAVTMPAVFVGIFGLPRDAPVALGYVVAAVLAAGTLLAEWYVYDSWHRGRWNRWLQGFGFLAFPTAGLLLVFRCHTALSSQMESALSSFRSYAAITPAQADSILKLLSEAWADHLNAVVMVMLLVAYLALLVLLGEVFTVPAPGKPLFSRRHWLLLPAGFGAVVVTDLLFYTPTFGHLPPWALSSYVAWVLTAIPILRQTSGTQRGGSRSAWPIVLSGVVAQVAAIGAAAAVGVIGMFELMSQAPAERRPALWAELSRYIDETVLALGAMVVLLAILLIAVCWRGLGWGTGASKDRAKSIALAAAMIGVIALSPLILLRDNDAAQIAMALPTWKPAIVEMVPAALEPKTAASFYIDRNPSSLRRGREDFWKRLGATHGAEDFHRAKLFEALAGHGQCSNILDASLGPDRIPPESSEAPPARCITAIEAQLYCEARGKRLPTPAEWDAALSATAPTPAEAYGRTGPLRRDTFAEWTMELVHDTPTFQVKGGGTDVAELRQLHPSAFSEDVGFRCAFTFDS